MSRSLPGKRLAARPWRARTRAAAFVACVGLLPLWAVGQWLRDATWLTGLCFYIPSALLAAVLSGWGLAHLWAKRRRSAAVAFCLALPPLGMALFVENRPFASQPEVAGAKLRLAHWNVAGKLPEGTRNVLLGRRADIYVLSEVADRPGLEALRGELGPEYHALLLGNLAVVAHGEIESSDWLLDHDRRRVRLVTWRRDGRTIALLLVDLPSDIFEHRDPLLREINALIERHRPDLVVGDFNAPRRSRALCDLPAGYRHAFDTAGAGCGYTWPVPVPMYALDQCIHAERTVPARYELWSSLHSDHRLQVFDFSLPGEE